MFKLPIRTNKQPYLTQKYANTSNNAWYASNGVNFPFHNGQDWVIASPTAQDTYGTALVCPFDKATVVKVTWDSPTSTKGNGVTIETNQNGKILQVVLWHTSEVTVKVGQVLKEGDVICYIGNSGLCSPKPTKDTPFAGSHLHLMVFEWDNLLNCWKDKDNGVGGAQDPGNYFDYQWYHTDSDTGYEHDKWVITEYLKGMDIVSALKYVMKFFTIKK